MVYTKFDSTLAYGLLMVSVWTNWKEKSWYMNLVHISNTYVATGCKQYIVKGNK